MFCTGKVCFALKNGQYETDMNLCVESGFDVVPESTRQRLISKAQALREQWEQERVRLEDKVNPKNILVCFVSLFVSLRLELWSVEILLLKLTSLQNKYLYVYLQTCVGVYHTSS